MQDGSDLTPDPLPGCLSDDRPCGPVARFCDRMATACDLARRVTGAVPDFRGTVAPECCRFGRSCRQHWQVQDGVLSLTRDGRALHAMPIRLQ
ncbi:MAG: hypothetical protein ACOCYW_08160 [Roseicyclus sp.]